jgi:hypothetical protein
MYHCKTAYSRQKENFKVLREKGDRLPSNLLD